MKIIKAIISAAFLLILFIESSFAAGKWGIGFTSMSLTSFSASGPQLVVIPFDPISIKASLYSYIYNYNGPQNYLGGEIACYYNYPSFPGSRIIPQIGASIAEINYWAETTANTYTRYTFRLLMGIEWFIYDYLSVSIVWPFFECNWENSEGYLNYATYKYFINSANAGITLYF